jgi:hypothetical protein
MTALRQARSPGAGNTHYLMPTTASWIPGTITDKFVLKCNCSPPIMNLPALAQADFLRHSLRQLSEYLIASHAR